MISLPTLIFLGSMVLKIAAVSLIRNVSSGCFIRTWTVKVLTDVFEERNNFRHFFFLLSSLKTYNKINCEWLKPISKYHIYRIYIQTDANHLNKYYSWSAVVFIQVVCIGLYCNEFENVCRMTTSRADTVCFLLMELMLLLNPTLSRT